MKYRNHGRKKNPFFTYNTMLSAQGFIMSHLDTAGIPPSTLPVVTKLIGLMSATKVRRQGKGLNGYWCHPTQRWLGGALERSRQRINHHIKVLVEAKIIKKIRVGCGRANIYKLGAWLRSVMYLWSLSRGGQLPGQTGFFDNSDVKETRQLYGTSSKPYTGSKSLPCSEDKNCVQLSGRLLPV